MFRNKSDDDKLAKILGYTFKDQTLLLRALTRTSGLLEGRQKKEIGDFQRLEFIGDRVLNLVISGLLLKFNPTWSEGRLTQKLAQYTNNNGPLAHVARRLHLGDFLIMGVGEERNNSARENVKVLSDAMEALIGALWLDTNENYEFIKEFILNL
jgi:ribonuclease-3